MEKKSLGFTELWVAAEKSLKSQACWWLMLLQPVLMHLRPPLAQLNRSRSKAHFSRTGGRQTWWWDLCWLVSRSLFLAENCPMYSSRTRILQTSQGRCSINSESIISLSVLGLKWNHREAWSCKSNCSWANVLCSAGHCDLVDFAVVQAATSAWQSAKENLCPQEGRPLVLQNVHFWGINKKLPSWQMHKTRKNSLLVRFFLLILFYL